MSTEDLYVIAQRTGAVAALLADIGLASHENTIDLHDLRVSPKVSSLKLAKASKIVWMDTAAFVSYCPPALYDRSTVVIHHIRDDEDWKYKACNAAHVIVTDEFTRSKVCSRIPSTRVHRCRTGFSKKHFRMMSLSERAEVRRQFDVDDDRLLICLNGVVRPHKQFEHVIESLSELAQSRTDFSIVTCGQGWAQLLQDVDSFPAFYLEPNAPTKRVAEIVGSSDLLISNSYCEGGPLPVAEALACGTRVLATEVGQVSEWLAACPDGAGSAYRVPSLTYAIISTELLRNSDRLRSQTAEAALAFEYDALISSWTAAVSKLKTEPSRPIRRTTIYSQFGRRYLAASMHSVIRRLAGKVRSFTTRPNLRQGGKRGNKRSTMSGN